MQLHHWSWHLLHSIEKGADGPEDFSLGQGSPAGFQRGGVGAAAKSLNSICVPSADGTSETLSVPLVPQ